MILLWNVLPPNIRDIASIYCFECALNELDLYFLALRVWFKVYLS